MEQQTNEFVQHSKNIWTIVIFVLGTALIAGGGIFLWQQSKITSIQNDLQALKFNLQNQTAQSQSEKEILKQQVADLQFKLDKLNDASESKTDNNSSVYCTKKPTPTDIGYDKLPIDPKYKNLNWLGQIFTAYNCGLERVDKIFGVENGFFTIGLNITLKNYPDGQLINIFNLLGFSCIDESSNSAGNCKEWGCEKSIKIDALMKLEPYYNNFQRDDCVRCG